MASCCGGTVARAETDCRRYSLENLSLGLTFGEVRKTMGSKPGNVQTVADARGATSTVTYARSPASLVLQFDQDVAKTSQAKLGSIAWCMPQDLTSMAEVVKDLSSRLGEPTSRSPGFPTDKRFRYRSMFFL